MKRLGVVLFALFGLVAGAVYAAPVGWTFSADGFTTVHPNTYNANGSFIYDPMTGTPSDGLVNYELSAALINALGLTIQNITGFGTGVPSTLDYTETRSAVVELTANDSTYEFSGDTGPDLSGSLLTLLAFDTAKLNAGLDFTGTITLGLCANSVCSLIESNTKITVPTEFSVAPVPVPASILLLGSAMGVFGLRRRRR